MKKLKIYFTLFIMIALLSCNNTSSESEINPDLINVPATASRKESKDQAILTFKSETHDFGTIKEGAKMSFAFKFTNTGNSELIISNCVPACGCTVPEFPRYPIKAGESDFIKIVFDSKGRKGKFNKNVSVYSNTVPNVRQLYIKGKVIK